jgi:putative DNA primase/helicase
MNNLERLTATRTPLDAALAAMDCGFWPVPIRADDGKRPLGDDWSRAWTETEIKSAFNRKDANGIGLILGPGPAFPIFDIDLDSDEAITAMQELFGPSAEYTLGFRASRGNHWLYQWDERLDVLNAAVKHWPLNKGVSEQIEIRLGCSHKSAQTVIPPTWHKGAGVSRSWILPPNGNFRIIKAPDSVIERLVSDFSRKPVAVDVQAAQNRLNSLVRQANEDHPYNVRAIEKILAEAAAATDGGRNNAVYKAAWQITSLMTSQNLSPDSGLTRLGMVAASLGLQEAEYATTIRNGWRWGKENPRSAPMLMQVNNATVTTKKKPKREVEQEELDSSAILSEDEYTDLKFAELVIASFGDRFRYVEPWKTWVSWDANNGVWVQSQCMHHEYFKEFAIGDDIHLGSAAKIRAAAAMAMSDRRIMAKPDNFDSQVDYLNVRNGVLDLTNGELLNHDPAFMSTKQADVEFSLSARCPKFTATLELVQPDPEIRSFLQRWLGTVLCGRTLAESVVNYGDGANGKSTILESVGMVMGSYFAKMPRGFIAKSKSDRHPAELVTLYGARFALASETDISDAMDEAKIKMILGDGSITARRMNENFWSFIPTHKFAIAANHMPSIVGQDSGIWRRLAFVPWQVTIPEEQRQPEYEKVLFEEEASGILNWLLEGYRQYQSIGLAIPEQVKAAGKGVQELSDWLGEFFAECLTTKPKAGYHAADRIRASQVYELYKKWAGANSLPVLPSNKAIPLFKRRAESMDVKVKNYSNVWWYLGLRAKDETDHEGEADAIGLQDKAF